MTTFTPKQRRDIVMMRGLNRTYSEIAEYLNAKHGIDVSGRQVGNVVRNLEARSQEESAEAVFNQVVMHGWVGDLTERL